MKPRVALADLPWVCSVITGPNPEKGYVYRLSRGVEPPDTTPSTVVEGVAEETGPIIEAMRSRRRLWIGFGALCALAVGIAYLAPPDDEFALIHRLSPHESSDSEYHIFSFDAPIDRVCDAVEASAAQKEAFHQVRPGQQVLIVLHLPGRKHATLFGPYPQGKNGPTCEVWITGDDRSWYQRAWSTFKYRLGL